MLPFAAVAPSHAFDPGRLERGIGIARHGGFEISPLPDLMRPVRYLAAPDDHRAAQLKEALISDAYEGVWLVRGGSGLGRILHYFDEVEVSSDRPVIGFSDLTALFCALHPRGAGRLIHGPVLHSLEHTDAEDRDHLWDLLRGQPSAPMTGQMWAAGEATGWMCGGNLCVLASLCGTPWQLDAKGGIVVLEEIGEHPYRIDRTLQQLRSAGVFDGVAGIALGQMLGCDPPEGADWRLQDVFADHFGGLGVPVIADLPIGHGARNRPFQWGAQARIHDGVLAFESTTATVS